MKKFKKVLILVILCTAITCSFWAIFSQSNMSVSKAVPPEDVPIMPNIPEKLPRLTSDEEAIALADEFLKEQLGLEFFTAHFKVIGVDKIDERYSWWNVEYEYRYNEYTVDLSVSINVGRIPLDSSRIDVEYSDVILEPQKILISEEQARIIAQENGLEPPYKIILCCKLHGYRICWQITRKDADLKCEDLAGFLIDAETGEVLDTIFEDYYDGIRIEESESQEKSESMCWI
ncbi:MAG: hypothetical protein PVF58_11140 [Candidatus Methanofastidiosia archaeon]